MPVFSTTQIRQIMNSKLSTRRIPYSKMSEPRTFSLELMRSNSLAGSEYFLFPGNNGDNLFVKVIDDMDPKDSNQSPRELSYGPRFGREGGNVAGNRGRSKAPLRDGKAQAELERKRSRSAGSILAGRRRLTKTDIQNPSPVASYINQSTDSNRGSRTSFMSVDSYEDSLPSNDSTDNVSVVVRVRPFVDLETRRGDAHVAQNLGGGSILIDNGCSKPFTFNAVFDENTSQSEFFNNCGVMRLVDKALEGFSCTVFAYGPTGSGKTHTITGPDGSHHSVMSEDCGLIQRSFMYLFDQISTQSEVYYYLKVSYLEVYNEKVKDLLNPSGPDSLKIRWTKNRGFHVENLFTVECETIEDIMIILEEGINHRQMGVSNSNEHSSRSHCLLLCEVMSEALSSDDNTMYIHRHGHLTFVDLAGSEKLNQTSEGNLVETTNINKSLLALGNCISCLSDTRKRSGHIPYRESKLTQLLADSLGGNGITLMVACVSPSSSNMTESLNTLRYANRAKKIKNKPFVLMDPREKEIVSLRREVGALRNENEYLRSQIDLPKEQTITQLALKSAKLKMREGEGEGEGDGSLYEMVQAYMIENEKLRRDTSELTHSRDKLTHQLQDLAQENSRLVKKLEQFERFVAMMQQGANTQPSQINHNGSHRNINGPTTLVKPAMAPQLNNDQQFNRKQVGLPPVTSNKGVPNGFTSPRGGNQADVSKPNNQIHRRSGSFKSSSQTMTHRSNERNSDSGVFSDEENDNRRRSRVLSQSLPSNRSTNKPNGLSSFDPKTQRNQVSKSMTPYKAAQKLNPTFANSETHDLAQINQKLLKDIQSLDSEIELYQQRVKKPRK